MHTAGTVMAGRRVAAGSTSRCGPGSGLRRCNPSWSRPGPCRAVLVTLTAAERNTLKMRVRRARTPWLDRLRAQIVLAAARGRINARIAADLGINVDTVRRWRVRDVQEAASHADPRTTMRYDRARTSLDRHATYIVATYIAGAAR